MSTASKTQPKTLLLGLALGNFVGLLLLCGGLPLSRRFVEAAFPYSAFGYYAGDFLVFLSLVLGTFVFPAILSSIAKRLYALWGLLPIFLLVLWLVAGCISAHRLLSLLDPPWALPISIAVCWAIASFPISLFRFLRRRYKQNATSVSNAVSTKPALGPMWRQICFLVPLILILLAGILGWHNLSHPKHFSVVMQSHWLSGKEAIVPLVEHGNGLYVKAWLNNQEVLCKVDTGSESVEWSRGLHVEGKVTTSQGQDCDLLGGCVATQTLLLPRLKIGNYEITNIPTEMSEAGSGPFTPVLEDAGQQPLLGNTAFVQTVLTVDYKKAQLIIRSPQYDFLRQPRKPGDRVLEMGWASHYSNEDWRKSCYGTPAIEATLGSAPFWCTLDTGAGGSEICLTQTLVDNNPFVKQRRHNMSSLNATSSSAQVERLYNLNVKFPCSAPPHSSPIALNLNGVVTPTLRSDPVEGTGVIGFPLMQRYRITIDYGRGCILLEPYQKVKNTKKQEKPPKIPKLPGI